MVANVSEVKSTMKSQMKKALCLAVAGGHARTTDDELVQSLLSCQFPGVTYHWERTGGTSRLCTSKHHG